MKMARISWKDKAKGVFLVHSIKPRVTAGAVTRGDLFSPDP